jgi:hypothetical protein
MKASISEDLIPVRPNDRGGMGKWLTVDVPNGWDDVRKICKKILQFEGRNYAFRGWNSDRNEAFFRESTQIAKVI